MTEPLEPSKHETGFLLAISLATGHGLEFKDLEARSAVLQAMRDYHQSRRQKSKAEYFAARKATERADMN